MELSDLIKLEGLTTMPLIFGLSLNQTYDFDLISQHAHAVHCPVTSLLFYPTIPSNRTDYSPVSYSSLVRELHNHNLAVFARTLKDDQLQWQSTIENETAMIVLKGVDGVFADYPLNTFQSL
jgi:hypothetical protein